jgi:hypothetical protein
MATSETVLSKGYVGLLLSFEQANNSKTMKMANSLEHIFIKIVKIFR